MSGFRVPVDGKMRTRYLCVCRYFGCGERRTYLQNNLSKEPTSMRGALVAAATLSTHITLDREHDSVLSHIENTQTMENVVINRTLSQTLSFSGTPEQDRGHSLALDSRRSAIVEEEDQDRDSPSTLEDVQDTRMDHSDEEPELARITEAVLHASRDLMYLYETVGQRIQTFSYQPPLDFSNSPGSIPLDILHESSAVWQHPPNTSTLQLNPDSPLNRTHLTHENHLHHAHSVLISLGDIDVPAYRAIYDKVADQIDSELLRLISMKNDEWHRQSELLKDGKEDLMAKIAESTVNTGMSQFSPTCREPYG